MRTILRLALPAVALCAISAAAPSRAQAQQRVRCESHGYDRSYCNVDTRGRVAMVRQLSSAACVQGRTWGTARQGIWVSNGCRADFDVSGSGRYGGSYNNGAYNNNGRWNRAANSRYSAGDAENRCVSEVQSRILKRDEGGVRLTGNHVDANTGAYLVDWVSARQYGQCQVVPDGHVYILHHKR